MLLVILKDFRGSGSIPNSIGTPTNPLGSRNLKNASQEARFEDFLNWAPEVGRMKRFSDVGSRSTRNDVQATRFDVFLTLALEVCKMITMKLELCFLMLAPEFGKMIPKKLDL